TSIVNKMAVLAAYLMQDDKIWAAVQALAQKLPAVGRMWGLDAVKTVNGIVSASDLTAEFTEALEEISRLETEIEAEPVVIVEYPDGTKAGIKGYDQIEGKTTITAVT